ncbi:MAG: hypothetical protein ABI425_04140 [Patescibacteria group bacterium]
MSIHQIETVTDTVLKEMPEIQLTKTADLTDHIVHSISLVWQEKT